jgi:transposase-like protein
MTLDLTAPEFHDDDAARAWLENSRWPNGANCPHCGSLAVARMGGSGHRPGLFHCPDCRGQFTVLTGGVMESSHISLPKWVLAIRLMTASKKGVSAHQIHRMLNIGYKSAWFMCHRIREAMREENPAPLGGEGKIVEADEAYHGKRETPRVRNKYSAPPTKRGKGGGAQKRPIVALVERGGEVRATHMNQVTGKNLRDYMVRNASRQSRLHTDESPLYDTLGKEFAKHETVNHSRKEYARDDVTTNTVEGYFGVFKRGMVGVYQHCGEQHLQRYLDEFSFRWNNRKARGVEDAQRAVIAAHGAAGKRLTYRRTHKAPNPPPIG